MAEVAFGDIDHTNGSRERSGSRWFRLFASNGATSETDVTNSAGIATTSTVRANATPVATP